VLLDADPEQLTSTTEKIELINRFNRFLIIARYHIKKMVYFGSGTEFAVKYFQHENSIRAMGLVDLDTWKALLAGTVLPGNDIDGNGAITPEEFRGM
jgi:peptidoglycan hydrolase-like protein with peptidoglycan-binding domain